MLAAPAADMKAEFAGQRREAALQRPEHAGRDAGGVPVLAHDAAEGLKPERMSQPAQQFVTPVMMDDRLANHRAEPRHAMSEPGRHPAAMQRKIGASRASRHQKPHEIVPGMF